MGSATAFILFHRDLLLYHCALRTLIRVLLFLTITKQLSTPGDIKVVVGLYNCPPNKLPDHATNQVGQCVVTGD